jgi:branched-chain amino acid transport system ATP-binding protein
MIELTNVTAGYGKLDVLRNLNLTFERGMITLLLGHNGAGKSTILKSIMGIVRVSSGEIRYGDTNITDMRSAQRVRRGIAFVPQTSNEGRGIFPTHTVRENLHLGAYTATHKRLINEGVDRTFRLFPILAERSNQNAGLLSGGQQQMLALSMALMLKPQLLLLDEPTSGLAPLIGKELMDHVALVRDELDLTVVIVEQNVEVGAAIANRGVVLRQGAVHRFVDPRDIGGATSVLDLI